MPLSSIVSAGFGMDGELADAAAGGSNELPAEREATFGMLVERHSRVMFRVAFSLLRNAQDAEDAVQEAFLKLYRGDAWRRMEDEKAFLARTVWRVALDRLPRSPERSLEADEPFASGVASPEATALRGAQSALLRRMIDALPEDLRQVLVLSAIEELNSREIAEMIGVPEGTVRTRLMRAKEELRKRYQASAGRSR
ncbi:RNA polymerase sigma-70 factor (ECF subfamily) [Granulicella aggregans]|uniref:RNA polymerase sigma-70 factor (ECF subfamily) n=1 Tax=Granulicella aggregans TaxID=474949 RepID=A0A7W7ZD09_9BACT|nr:RNA polymerase sigma factor [Granulicella aggregans]MBB5057314.1 RNA polymerase sigma-70 factor (ECF subfamily) [Granulicella aggregans]